jgi:hypothetical protein
LPHARDCDVAQPGEGDGRRSPCVHLQESGSIVTELAQRAHDQMRQMVGFSAADEIEKLDRLKASNSISEDEYARLRAKLVQ